VQCCDRSHFWGIVLLQGHQNAMLGNDPWGPSVNTHHRGRILLDEDDDDEDMTSASPVLPLNGGGSLTQYASNGCPLDSPRVAGPRP
jgi:hypothetical protein